MPYPLHYSKKELAKMAKKVGKSALKKIAGPKPAGQVAIDELVGLLKSKNKSKYVKNKVNQFKKKLKL